MPMLAAAKAKQKKVKAPPKKAKWSTADDHTLIETLKAQQAAGNQADNNWKKVVWVAAHQALIGSESLSGGAPKKAKSCSDRWGTLKSQFLIIQTLRGLSGFGWDEDRSMVTATGEVWSAYIEAHPNAATWHSKPFPLYDDILSLVEGRYATGDKALHMPVLYDNKLQDDESPADEGGDENSALEDEAESPFTPPQVASAPSSQPEHAEPINIKRKQSTASLSDVSLGSGHHIKRKQSTASLSDVGPTTASKRSRLTGPLAVQHVADALSLVASSLSTGENQESGTPQRRARAIKTIMHDESLTEEERIKGMRLFRKDIAIADTYLAIDESKQALRTGYIKDELANF